MRRLCTCNCGSVEGLRLCSALVRSRSALPVLRSVSGVERKTRGREDIFFSVAWHCIAPLRRSSFAEASMELRGKKEFMLPVLKLEPSLCGLVAPILRNDFDLLLVAFSGDASVVEDEVSRLRQQRDNFDHIEDFRIYVLNPINVHSIFATVLLPGFSQLESSGCVLATLNRGAATLLGYKVKLAEYLDVPTGRLLRLLRRASRNLDSALGTRNEGHGE